MNLKYIEGFMWRHIKPSHVCDRHVRFLITWNGIGKYNKMFRYFLFSSYHNTKLQLSDKNISTHARVILKICYELNPK